MKFSHVLVALDMTAHDLNLLKIARYIANKLDSKRTYFAHVLPQLDFSADVAQEIDKLNSGKMPISQQIQSRIQSEVEQFFPLRSGKSATVLVAPGKPYVQITEWANTYDTNLLIIGHKAQSKEYSMNAIRLARKLKSSVWFVPEGRKTSVNNILVPIDFSENSMRALQTAILWKAKDNRIKVTPCFIYSKALSYYVYGEYYSWALNEDIHEYYQQYQAFLNRYAIDGSQLEELILAENERFNVANTIQQRARKGKFDLVMLGAKGHSALHNFVIGSVTEELLMREKEVSIMLVR